MTAHTDREQYQEGNLVASQFANSKPAVGEIDLIELWNIAWKSRVLIVAITLAFAVISVVYALFQTNIYRAEAVLAPADSGQSGGPLAGQLGAAASLVGINIDDENSQITNAIATLRSRDFTRNFIERYGLLIPLMASKWSNEERRNVVDPDLFDEVTNTWIREDGPAQPTDWEAYRAFSRILFVSEDRETNLVRVAIEWPDPQQAAQWVNWLVADINRHVKEQDLNEATDAIEYLRRQLQSTQLVEMQRVFYQLIESQTRIVMLADVRDEYVLQIIDPAVVPEERVRPRRALICIIGTMLGGMFAVIFVFLRHFASTRLLRR